MNILDVAQNGIKAGARLVRVTLCKCPAKDEMTLSIADDGCGMDEETRQKALDPFYTSRSTRKVGLGLPFLQMAAELAGGSFALESEPGVGTEVRASFRLSHIDLAPLGDMGQTIAQLAAASEDCDILFAARVEDGEEKSFAGREAAFTGREAGFTFDTREARELLGGVSLAEAAVMVFVTDYVNEHFQALWGA